VDVVDQHDTYVRQWQLRARYYRKCAYAIEHVNRPKSVKDEAEEGKESKPKNEIVTEEKCMITLSLPI
jgi:hypothetical protein